MKSSEFTPEEMEVKRAIVSQIRSFKRIMLAVKKGTIVSFEVRDIQERTNLSMQKVSAILRGASGKRISESMGLRMEYLKGQAPSKSGTGAFAHRGTAGSTGGSFWISPMVSFQRLSKVKRNPAKKPVRAPSVPEALKKAAKGLFKWRGTAWMGGSDVLTWVMKDGTYGFAVQGSPLRLQAKCLNGDKSEFNNYHMSLDVDLQKKLGLDVTYRADRYGGQVIGGAGQTMGEGNISIDELAEGITSILDRALDVDGKTHFTLMPTKGMPWNAGSKCTPYYSAKKRKVLCGTKPEGLIKTQRYLETSKGSSYVKVDGVDFCTLAPLIKETEGGIVGTITAQDDDRFFLTHSFNLDDGGTAATVKAISKCGGLLYPSLAIADVPPSNFGTCCFVARLPLALRMLKPYKDGATRGVAPVTVYNTDAWTDVTRDFAGAASADLFDQMTGTWEVSYNSHMKSLGPRLMEDARSFGPDVKVIRSVSHVLKEFKRKRGRWTRGMTYADIEQASDSTDLRYPYMEVKVNGVLQVADTFPIAVCPSYLKSKTQKFLKAIGFNGHLITVPVKGHIKDALQHKVPGLEASTKATWDYAWMVRDAILAWQEKQDEGKRYGDKSRWIEWVEERIYGPSPIARLAARYGHVVEEPQLFNTPTLVKSNPARRRSMSTEDWEMLMGQAEKLAMNKGLESTNSRDMITMLAWESGYEGEALPDWFLKLAKHEKINVQREHADGAKVGRESSHRPNIDEPKSNPARSKVHKHIYVATDKLINYGRTFRTRDKQAIVKRCKVCGKTKMVDVDTGRTVVR